RYFQHPRLQQADACLDAAQQVELIGWEYQQRWKNGDRPRRSDYQAAFPEHADALHGLKPLCRCPRCRRMIAVEELAQTVRWRECGGESPLDFASAQPAR